MNHRFALTQRIVLAALFAALMAVCSQIQIPLPMVPINLALFAVHLCGALLGAKWGALSISAYALLGLVGAPVYAGFASGPAALRSTRVPPPAPPLPPASSSIRANQPSTVPRAETAQAGGI